MPRKADRPPPPKPTVERAGRPIEDLDPILRECRHHGLAPHGRYRAGPRFRVRCKRCVAEDVTRRHQKVRGVLLAEAGGRCAVCGYDACVFNLHFHHVDPATKAFNMNMGSGKSLAAYREEARKCVLVCANCHGEIESGIRESPPAGARYAPPAM